MSSPSLSPEHQNNYEFLRGRLDALRRAKTRNITQVLAALEIVLRSKYPDAEKYVLFSLFSGDALSDPSGPFDFPGTDSLEKFINDQYISTFPDYVLFSMLSKASLPEENGSSDYEVPETIAQFINGQYAATYPKGESRVPDEPEEEDRLKWLESPLQLQEGIPLPKKKPKLTISPAATEIPYHAKLEVPPLVKKRKRSWLHPLIRAVKGNKNNHSNPSQGGH